MTRADVITLVSETPSAHGVLDTSFSPTERTVMCTVRSVGMTEMYTAMSQGLNPSYTFVLALAEDYNGERKLIFHNDVYRVIRTYMAGDGIEITAERWSSDV